MPILDGQVQMSGHTHCGTGMRMEVRGESTLSGLYRSMLSLFRLRFVSLERGPNISAALEGWKLLQSVIVSRSRLDRAATAATVAVFASLQVEFLGVCCGTPNHFILATDLSLSASPLGIWQRQLIMRNLMKLQEGGEGTRKGLGRMVLLSAPASCSTLAMREGGK